MLNPAINGIFENKKYYNEFYSVMGQYIFLFTCVFFLSYTTYGQPKVGIVYQRNVVMAENAIKRGDTILADKLYSNALADSLEIINYYGPLLCKLYLGRFNEAAVLAIKYFEKGHSREELFGWLRSDLDSARTSQFMELLARRPYGQITEKAITKGKSLIRSQISSYYAIEIQRLFAIDQFCRASAAFDTLLTVEQRAKLIDAIDAEVFTQLESHIHKLGMPLVEVVGDDMWAYFSVMLAHAVTNSDSAIVARVEKVLESYFVMIEQGLYDNQMYINLRDRQYSGNFNLTYYNVTLNKGLEVFDPQNLKARREAIGLE
ncbi:MAG: hypothetical protein RL660_1332 [Bacteroidota bacterium]|jgi:hypothetical protein